MDERKQPPPSVLEDELRAYARAWVCQGLTGLEDSITDRLSNLLSTSSPSLPGSSTNADSRSTAGLAESQSSLDAPLTKESKCFMLADAAVGQDVSSNPSAICATCACRLTTPQQAMARTRGTRFGVSSPDCYICAMKALKPESFTKPFCDFLTANPTIFHAVDYFKEKLNAAGFKEVCPWLIQPLPSSPQILENNVLTLIATSSLHVTTGPTRSSPAANTT